MGYNKLAAAEEAKKEAKNFPNSKLTALMCWDAVANLYAANGGVISGDNKNLVTDKDPIVDSSTAMRNIPPGALLGFFGKGGIAHMMISVGGGSAAGNKNQCLNIGNPLGWEVIDLSAQWGNLKHASGVLVVRYRDQ